MISGKNLPKSIALLIGRIDRLRGDTIDHYGHHRRPDMRKTSGMYSVLSGSLPVHTSSGENPDSPQICVPKVTLLFNSSLSSLRCLGCAIHQACSEISNSSPGYKMNIQTQFSQQCFYFIFQIATPKKRHFLKFSYFKEKSIKQLRYVSKKRCLTIGCMLLFAQIKWMAQIKSRKRGFSISLRGCLDAFLIDF